MSSVDQDAAILLGVSLTGDDLIVRIDKDTFGQEFGESGLVTQLELGKCKQAKIASDALTESLFDTIHYEIFSADQGGAIVFRPDFARPVDIECETITETRTDYLPDELRRKCSWLGDLYKTTENRYQDLANRYSALEEGLQLEIAKVLDRLQRKIEFFSETRPEKADAMRKQADLLTRILTLMTRIEVQHQKASG